MNHEAPARELGRMENFQPWTAPDPPPRFPAKKAQSFSCCSFLHGRSEPPGMTREEEKRLWREAIEQEIREEQRVRGTVDVSRDVDQIEVVPVSRDFQDKGHLGDVQYAEMDGVGMVFAPTAVSPRRLQSPGKEPWGHRPRDQKPWWKQDNWTDSSFHDTTATEMPGTDTGYSIDQTCEDTECPIRNHTSRVLSRDDAKIRTQSLLEQSREARSQSFRKKGLGLKVDTLQKSGPY